MPARIGAGPERHADRTLALLAVIAALCGVIVGIGEPRLTLGGSGSSVAPLVITVNGSTPLRFGPNRVALAVMESRLEATPGVTGTERGPVRAGGRSTTLVVQLSEDPQRSAAAVEAVESRLDPGPLQISFSGGASELRDAREQTINDLGLLLLAVPLAALVLVAALGSRAALATVFAAAAAVLGAGAICIGVSLFVDVSVLCLIGAAAGGLPAAILLCAMARHGTAPAALVAAALAAAVAFGSLAALGVGYLAAVGIGGLLACLLAAPLAMIAMRAAASLWQLGPSEETEAQRALARLVVTVAWSRAAAIALAVLSVGILAVIALPALRLEPGAFAAEAPPSISLERGLAVGAAAIACLFVIGWLASRRPLAALAAALCVPLAPAAAAGLAVIVFQDGHLEGLLDFDRFTIGVGPLAAGAVTVAAASAAQGIAAVTRDRGPAADPPPRRYADLATAAAAASLVAALAAASLLASSLEFAKAFALVAATGLLLDLVFVRGLLGVALTALASRRASARLWPDRVPPR